MFPRRVWIALLVIILLFWSGYQFVYDNRAVSVSIPKYIKYGVHFCLLLSIGLAGLYGWYKYRYGWITMLWKNVYIIAIALIGGLGLIDFLFRTPASFTEFIVNLKWFFASPVPYGIMMLLARYVQLNKMEKQEAKKESQKF